MHGCDSLALRVLGSLRKKCVARVTTHRSADHDTFLVLVLDCLAGKFLDPTRGQAK